MHQYLETEYAAMLQVAFVICIEKDEAFTKSWLYDRYRDVNTELAAAVLLNQSPPSTLLRDFSEMSSLVLYFAFEENNLTWAEFDAKTEAIRKKVSSCVFLEPSRLG